ncbi:esterase E4-like [Copidosoma floridanum]|uniref:esterase E4-like n=1 Tax=Copidosoma floridanum TaxID=29053 RepID=UPI000C6F5D95|nr:esterase E4-like [Copidosoma floridanum]
MDRPIVTISDGQLQGTTLKSVLGPNYYAFKGIPFAAPPLGSLRFKAPQPPEKWSGVRDASNYVGDACMQMRDDRTRAVVGSEDCLYLSVLTKTLSPDRPVMVFIHGGSFVEGTTNRDVYRQDYLVTQDVVLVNINYRMGPFGFLSLGHEVATSNVGLRDVIYSLRWVKNNVEAFGGDTNNITIFGSSAGALITHLLTLIPKAKGLFHKAIIQSGTCNNARTLVSKFDIKNGFRIAALLGMHSDDPTKVIEFLRTMPAIKLVQCEDHILTQEEAIQYGMRPYGPVIDVDYNSDPLIPGTFEELKNNNADIPIMIGHTSDESLLVFVDKFNDETYKYHNDHIESIIRNKLKDPTVFPELMKEVREFYLKNKPIDSENVWNLIRLTSDFSIHADRQIIDYRVESATAPTYVYMFSYMGDEPTIYQTDHGPQPLKGVAHADELSYLLYLAYFPIRKENPEKIYPKEGTLDRLVTERMIRMWQNFAATGNPTPETDDKYITTVWKPASKEHLYYLEINKDLPLRDDRDSKSWPFYEKNRDYFKQL